MAQNIRRVDIVDIFYEMDKSYEDLLCEKKNFLFVGEAGSGKTEIVLNTAVWLAQHTDKDVRVFDMDQSKPIFRSRDMEETFKTKGVTIEYQNQYLDAPQVVGGIRVSLMKDEYTLLDIGGGESAARVAGVFSHILEDDNAAPIYVINPYRPWTRSIETIDGTMTHILQSIRLGKIYVLCNPNLGYTTTADEFLQGLEKVDELLRGFTVVNSACVRPGIYEEVRNNTDKNLFPFSDLYMTYEWVDR